MTTTKTLIEAATLTEEEIKTTVRNVPPGFQWGRDSVIEAERHLVAAAARDKALWAFAAAFEEKAAHVEYTTGPPSGTYIIDQEDWWALRNALAGSERPKT